MNGKLVDTNILIYLSKRKLDFDKIASPKTKLSISVIKLMATTEDYSENMRNFYHRYAT